MASKFFDATIYRTTPSHGETTAGITFKPAPSLTQDELHEMISDLIKLSADMFGDDAHLTSCAPGA
ncbi:hypothetical protein [Bradyrhizobium sp. HKCCYLS20291]|uniref:hypothetical protein n=1 Tax=Bradyrhizobium sp. HKCCYLS20291 TaxID=3420766 RepID=UPI003EB977ED